MIANQVRGMNYIIEFAWLFSTTTFISLCFPGSFYDEAGLYLVKISLLTRLHPLLFDHLLFCAAYLDLFIILHFTARFLKASVIGILNYITVSEIKHFSSLYITVYVMNIWTSHASSCHLFHFFLSWICCPS
jgi:hypothetical protein